MNTSQMADGDSNKLAPATNNEQLATPVLSPITEHGDDGSSPFPAYRTNDGGPREAGNVEEKRRQLSNGDQEAVNGIREGHEEARSRTTARKASDASSPRSANGDASKMLKLSPRQIHDLTSSPGSLPFRPATPIDEEIPALANGLGVQNLSAASRPPVAAEVRTSSAQHGSASNLDGKVDGQPAQDLASVKATPGAVLSQRPGKATRSASSPILQRKQSSSRGGRPAPLKIENSPNGAPNGSLKPSAHPEAAHPSPMPPLIPIPPLSLPTYLQLELSSDRPSALYIHRSMSSDFPYESSKVKFDRLWNFIILPPQLEQVLVFGALACLDSWLYTFTILPLRFLKAIAVLLQWWVQNAIKEVRDLSAFVYEGLGRLWRRGWQDPASDTHRPSLSEGTANTRLPNMDNHGESSTRPNLRIETESAATGDRHRKRTGFRHRRTKSTPSALMPNHKADLLQGALILISCVVLMRFDASRMYHSIRGQAAIKLYVIYNVLEVFDRLFSALGQDVLECLFSKETLERKPDGRSKVIRPLWMFALALIYNVIHATALFYQVVTLNVAVNSYSNALLTLLMSNQFVEIKGTVFKKFEKENLFQLTCADVVERFQLWLMLLVIAMRNIVEVGGLTISLGSSSFSSAASSTSGLGGDAAGSQVKTSIIPKAFTLMPRWTGEVLGPFLIVLGSEMLVDWLKHAYITKFNNVKPNIYGRFLDVMTKDYYSHAFADQNLTKRLGLPVIPLSCLFIRASMQTYHMFVATHIPMPVPSAATAVSLESDSATTSPATMQALEHIDHIFRRALGRSSFGAGTEPSTAFSYWSLDDIIALATMAIFFLVIYLILLAFKLILGMVLLSFARSRYVGMKEREKQSTDAKGRRVGGWGVVEVNEEKRRWIYEDDPEGLRGLREKEAQAKAKSERGGTSASDLDGVGRYMMAAKRIW